MEKASLKTAVARTIEKWRMLTPPASVLVGVSGGADSVCLARILHELNVPVALAHVNHGWRGNASDQDARFVQDLARSLGLPFFVHQHARKQGNLEAEAREERRRFFDVIMEREGYQKLALAHSRDDRSETFLFHLLRGSGPSGLVSMRAVSGRTVRPLIETARSEIEAYLKGIGQPWREDSTNSDTRRTRNKIRHQVIPNLESEFNPRLTDALARTIDILEREDDWMEGEALRWLDSRTSQDGTGLILNAGDLQREPTALIRRVLRAALKRSGSPMRDIGFEHIESLRSLLAPGKSGRTVQLPGPIAVERNFDRLVFQGANFAPLGYEYELAIPGRLYIPEINAIFRADLRSPGAVKPKQGSAFVDGESLGPCVKIRNWKHGDSYHPVGARPYKLKDLFQKDRIPRRRRRQWPVVLAQSAIVWVASFPVSRDFFPTGSSRTIVEFEVEPSAESTG